jgi:hypothetical protein
MIPSPLAVRRWRSCRRFGRQGTGRIVFFISGKRYPSSSQDDVTNGWFWSKIQRFATIGAYQLQGIFGTPAPEALSERPKLPAKPPWGVFRMTLVTGSQGRLPPHPRYGQAGKFQGGYHQKDPLGLMRPSSLLERLQMEDWGRKRTKIDARHFHTPSRKFYRFLWPTCNRSSRHGCC